MVNILISSLRKTLSKNRFLFLIVCIFFFLLIGSFFDGYVGLRILIDLLVSLVFLLGIYAISQKYHLSITAALLALPMLVSLWLSHFTEIRLLNIFGSCCGILFFAFIIFHIFSFILKRKNITLEVINGGILNYLLIGLMWSFIFNLLELLNPGSFSTGESLIKHNRLHFTYYSFVTLTTLGYGDITPLTAPACSLSILEAIVGQIYLTVLIAILVGMHISQSKEK
jgi:voltage-gated potassium channel